MKPYTVLEEKPIPYFDHGKKLSTTVKNSSVRRGMSPLAFAWRKFRNIVLYRLAYLCPFNGLRIKMHRKRGITIGENVYIGQLCNLDNAYPEYIYIEDKEPPVVNWDGFSEDFYNGTVLAKMDGACKFSAPDLASRLKDKVSDNCNDVNYIKIVQTPAPGTPLKETTKVELSIFDNCNNSLDTSFVIKVLKRKTIVSVEAVDKSVCVTDGLDLESQTLRELSGTIEYFEDGGVTEERSQLFIDYYRDSISEGNLIYSDNPETYGERFGEQHKILLNIVFLNFYFQN